LTNSAGHQSTMTFFMLTKQNDGYSILFQRHFVNAFGASEAIGAYGLFPVDYAQLLSAQWSEITGVIDQANY
jgi:hypothetical protein